MKALQEIALGSAIALAAFCTVGTPGCGSALTPQLVQCKLAALSVLPQDPQMATVYDSIDLIERIKACHAKVDGGTP